MELTFVEPLDEAQQAEACGAIVTSMDEVADPDHVTCAMEQKSRRSRSLLAITYEATLTFTIPSSVAASDLEALEALLADEDLVVEAITSIPALVELNGGTAIVVDITEVAHGDHDDDQDHTDPDVSGSTVSSSASVLAFGASFFLGLAQQAQ
jgi:hypothetical protein